MLRQSIMFVGAALFLVFFLTIGDCAEKVAVEKAACIFGHVVVEIAGFALFFYGKNMAEKSKRRK